MSDLIAELHAVDTWRELAFRAVDELERLQAVVDAARGWNDYRRGKRPDLRNGFALADALEEAIRALDGEP